MPVPASTAEFAFGAAHLERLRLQSGAHQGAPGAVLAILAAVDREPEAWGGFSAEEERALGRLRRADDRAAFAMAHGLLRLVYGRMTGRPAATMDLAYEAGGRPFIAGQHHLQVSLSHARSVVAVAIGWDVAVGIDIEAMTAAEPDAGTLDLALTARERARVAAAGPAAARERCFLRFWTAKEAIFKARGLGIAAGLQTICLADGFDRPQRAQPSALGTGLEIAGFEQGASVCALAVGAGVRRLVVETLPVP